MNKVQKNYMIAKAKAEAAQAEYSAYMREWLHGHGYEVDDIADIEDDSAFEAVCDLFDLDTHQIKLNNLLNLTKEDLRSAENELIGFGLSLVPKSVRETLESSKSIEVRKKLIELVFRLDCKTIAHLTRAGR